MSVAELKEEAIRRFAIKVESMDDEAALKNSPRLSHRNTLRR